MNYSEHKRALKRTLRRPFEWLGIGLGVLVLSNLPHKALFKVCDFIAFVMFKFDRHGREMAKKNLAIMFATHPRKLTEREMTLLIRRSYRNQARSIGYAFWTFRNARAKAKKVGRMSESCRKFLAEHKPLVTVSGHIGCWEILSQLAFLEGHPMMSVAKDIGTKGMTELLMKARMSIGQEIVHSNGAFKLLMQGLKDGKSLGLLVDQVVHPKEGGIYVRYFGKPVPVSAAPAFFAAKAKVPIIIAWSRPLKDGTYRCEMVASFTSEEARDVWTMTQRCTKVLEGIVRRHPSCWILPYHYFGYSVHPDDLTKLEEREKTFTL